MKIQVCMYLEAKVVHGCKRKGEISKVPKCGGGGVESRLCKQGICQRCVTEVSKDFNLSKTLPVTSPNSHVPGNSVCRAHWRSCL